MNHNLIIGKNIKLFREKLGFSQEHIASFLGIKREMVSYYETGNRNIPVNDLQKLADIFGIELLDILEENENLNSANIALAFRAEILEQQDLNVIANFKKIIKNYIKLSEMDQ